MSSVEVKSFQPAYVAGQELLLIVFHKRLYSCKNMEITLIPLMQTTEFVAKKKNIFFLTALAAYTSPVTTTWLTAISVYFFCQRTRGHLFWAMISIIMNENIFLLF